VPDDQPSGVAGSVVVVTGASGGVGRGIARAFAEAGADVVVHYRRAAAAAAGLAAELGLLGVRAVAVAADLRDDADTDRLMRTAVEQLGRLDTLVNNAGIQPVEPLRSLSAAAWAEVMAVNGAGTFRATGAATAVMIERGTPGSVISIASIEAGQAAVGHAHYSASKAAVVMGVRAAALEFGRYGIRVNAVSPGLIDRPGLAEEWPEGVARWRAAAPLGRLGTPADVGRACVFLASPAASWITGQDLVVDGGVSVHPTW